MGLELRSEAPAEKPAQARSRSSRKARFSMTAQRTREAVTELPRIPAFKGWLAGEETLVPEEKKK